MSKVRLKFEKTGRARYISHLDLMKTLQRALTRAGVPVRYSEGFNPHIILSILLPLSLGFESRCELCDIELLTDDAPGDLAGALNRTLIEGIKVTAVYAPKMPVSSIAFCRYRITYKDTLFDGAQVFAGDVRIEKRSKRGVKDVLIGDYIRSISFTADGNDTVCDCILRAGQDTLNPEYITAALLMHGGLDERCVPLYVREGIYTENGDIFE